MGKATWWLRRIFGLKKPGPPAPSASDSQKQRWRFVASYREKRHSAADGDSSVAVSPYGPRAGPSPPPSRARTSKPSGAAEAAAPTVSRLTSARRSSGIAKAYVGAPPPREERAAVKIQAAFRAYLARRALRALKGLVKLQALVRGHMIRKHTAEYLRSIQALLRAQARARAERVQNSVSPLSSSKHSQLQCHDPVILGKYEQGTTRRKSTKHVWSSTPTRSFSKDKSHSAHSTRSDCGTDRILEVGIGSNSRRRLLFHSSIPTLSSDQNSHSFSFTTSKSIAHQVAPSPSFDHVKSPSLLKHPDDVEDCLFCSAENSPQFFSASSRAGSSRRVPFTPPKSDSSKSYLSDFLLDHPNYMACTASSRAKVRSLSAPKQRPEFEKSRSAKRNSVHGFCDSKPPRFGYANKAPHSIADWRDVEFQ